jgi:hypothetical protein
MKYTEVLSKRAAGSEEQAAVTQSPEFQTAFNNFLKGDGKSYMDKVSPGEIMRTALGATAGGGIGWLLSRFLHKKPKAWRTALYVLGGAAAGGYGTHWYLNNPDASGSTIAQRLRREYALTDPAVQQRIQDTMDLNKKQPPVPPVPTGGVNDKEVPGGRDTVAFLGTGAEFFLGKDNPVTQAATDFARDPLKVGEVLPQNTEEWLRVGATTVPGIFAGKFYNAGENMVHKGLLNWKINSMNRLDNLYRSGLLPQPIPKRMTGPTNLTIETNGDTRRFIGVPTMTTSDRVVNAVNAPLNWLRQRRINAASRLQRPDIADHPFLSVGPMGVFRSNTVNGHKFVVDNGPDSQPGKRFVANPDAFEGFDPKSMRYRTLGKLRAVGGGIPGFLTGLIWNAAERSADHDAFMREQQLLLGKPITK